MDYSNQAQYGPAAGAAEPQGAQPQPGGLYQFQPGVGFVPVQGQPAQAQAAGMEGQAAGAQAAGQSMGTQGMGSQTMGGSAAFSQGMYGQGMPEGAQPKFDQNKLGQMYGVMTDVMNGEAEPTKLLGLLDGTGGEFWKGALVGAAAVVLLNNDAVKGALAGLAASAGSMFREADPEGEQVTVGSK
ncbi:hypothetical protein GKC30_03250 [Pseudodesulfovibrio sp. F-1]|uniref:Uncharacterized protein n=1 Tax=Pseudodesulfovibrio alkaliphilus TaxID=2661613 RepID=A0A7K1KKV8_9BACT|nr:hypothetical protein [Pseudodesulfovibrio alkaliphilus]MUM76647.1 hypothetical protein [Pseudodesulfovibrio alkaliphilus]